MNAPLKAVGVETMVNLVIGKPMTVTGKVREETAGQAIFSLFTLGCSSCSRVIERKLPKLRGIKKVAVNYITDTVFVEYDPSEVTTESIRAFMKKLGYDASLRSR